MAEEPGYKPQLDSLRGFAILSVLYTHFCDPNSVVGSGGVRLFFVLSGFLITRNLLRLRRDGQPTTGAPSRLLTFFARRVLRLWPAYYLLLAAVLFLNVENIRSVAFWHLGFASNILFVVRNAYPPWPTSPWWTVDVEEQFYLLWPFVILFPPVSMLRWPPIAAIIIGISYHCIMAAIGNDALSAWFLLPASFDALGAGALLAVVHTYRRRYPAWLPWAGIIAFIPMMLCVLTNTAYWLADSLTILPAAAVIAAADQGFTGIAGRVMNFKPLHRLGHISYGIYLYHMFVLAAVFHIFRTVPLLYKTGPVLFVVASAASIAVASLSWRFIESPANALKRYFPYTLPQNRQRDAASIGYLAD